MSDSETTQDAKDGARPPAIARPGPSPRPLTPEEAHVFGERKWNLALAVLSWLALLWLLLLSGLDVLSHGELLVVIGGLVFAYTHMAARGWGLARDLERGLRSRGTSGLRPGG